MLKPWTIVIQNGKGQLGFYTGYDINTKLRVIALATRIGWEFDVEDESY